MASMVNAEFQKARRGKDKALFVEDFFFKFGKIPGPIIGFSPPGGMPFAPVRRRYDGYKKFAPRIVSRILLGCFLHSYVVLVIRPCLSYDRITCG